MDFDAALQAAMAFVLTHAGPSLVVFGSVWIFSAVLIGFIKRIRST